MRTWIGIGLLGWVAACTGPELECSEAEACGFGETCVEGTCVEAGCATSAQCDMEFYCNNRVCVPGCEGDDDCYPGSECDREQGVCVESRCVETSVDCGFREFCNTATGDCYDAGGNYCKPCDADNQTADCGEDNYCLAGYCGVDCSGGRECPSGFECYPFGDEFGNVITFQCFTYCWLYEDYDPGAFSLLPLDERLLFLNDYTCDATELPERALP